MKQQNILLVKNSFICKNIHEQRSKQLELPTSDVACVNVLITDDLSN